MQISSSKLETKAKQIQSKFPHQMRQNKIRKRKKKYKKIEFSIAICFFGKQRTCHQVVDNQRGVRLLYIKKKFLCSITNLETVAAKNKRSRGIKRICFLFFFARKMKDWKLLWILFYEFYKRTPKVSEILCTYCIRCVCALIINVSCTYKRLI